jgi:hypothetical protein
VNTTIVTAEAIDTTATVGIRYLGTVVSVPPPHQFGFIGIATVTTEEGGAPVALKTTVDVFIHGDDCNSPIVVGMDVTFFVAEDRVRGSGTYRASGAVQVEKKELLPAGSLIEGLTIRTESRGGALVTLVPRSQYHLAAKAVDEETLAQAAGNNPMEGIPRDTREATEDEKAGVISALLASQFPTLGQFGADYSILNMEDAELEAQVAAGIADLELLQMRDQVTTIKREVAAFKERKAAVRRIWDRGLVHPNTMLPIRYLPDLFMAVPVWYFWVKPERLEAQQKIWKAEDPMPQREVMYFSKLFPTQRWAHTYQMFNRRMRSLQMYRGDKIPPHVARCLREATEVFDHVVIATPYHREAGLDWQNIDWLQMIDPYVLGFKDGIPFFFVLARFSDTGIFPLYHDMLADTVDFLRMNSGKLEGFNRVSNPYWVNAENGPATTPQLGDILMAHTAELIAAFERGTLFDWLRGEEVETGSAIATAQ